MIRKHAYSQHAGLHQTTCRAALHLQSLVITLNTAHTNLRHTAVIITFTFGFIFLHVLYNVHSSMLWVPDGLSWLFDSPSVRIYTDSKSNVRLSVNLAVLQTKKVCMLGHIVSTDADVGLRAMTLLATCCKFKVS